MLMPLYGFLRGDTMGLLILAQDTDTVAALAARLLAAARVRRELPGPVQVEFRGRPLDGRLTLAAAGLTALDRFDVAPEDAASPAPPDPPDAGRSP